MPLNLFGVQGRAARVAVRVVARVAVRVGRAAHVAACAVAVVALPRQRRGGSGKPGVSRKSRGDTPWFVMGARLSGQVKVQRVQQLNGGVRRVHLDVGGVVSSACE